MGKASLTKCLYIIPALRPSCQQHNLSPNHVGSTKQRLMLLRVRNLHLLQPRSRDAILANTTFRSKSFSAVSVILTFTRSVASGVRCPLSIHVFLDMRSSAVLPRWAPQSPSLSPATIAAVGCMVDSDGNCPRVSRSDSNSSVRT